MSSTIIEKAIIKYLIQEANSEDLNVLSEWIKIPENQIIFEGYVKIHYKITLAMKDPNVNEIKENLLQKIKKDQNKVRRLKIRKRLLKYSAAAAFVGILATSYFLRDTFFNEDLEIKDAVLVDTKNIVPGTDKATLTLADGSQLTLEKGASVKTKDASSNGEKIVYDEAKQNSTEIKYNYLTIPRGGQFYLKLSDGTQVWVNSESQLKYPVSFVKGETRKVELIYGEAYFDVSPSSVNEGANFKVYNNSQEVEVLGTEFNIKAYKDESNIYTTLVEGKVSVDTGVLKQNLVPNQQSNLNRLNKTMTVAVVDVNNEISWKNGIFSFVDKPLKDIMKVISRWYDVDIYFENTELESVQFVGTLDKYQSIDEILAIMKSSSINSFVIKDRLIILK